MVPRPLQLLDDGGGALEEGSVGEQEVLVERVVHRLLQQLVEEPLRGRLAEKSCITVEPLYCGHLGDLVKCPV